MLSKAFWCLFSPLVRQRWFRRRLNSFVLQAQVELGAGGGASVESSGEAMVFPLLFNQPVRCERKSFCIFDVGTNKGQYLDLALNSLLGRQFSVHSFEPSAATLALLKNKFGSLPDVHLNPFGLGGESGEFDLYSDAEASGLASLTRRRLDHLGIQHQMSERVRIETLDGYCGTHGIENIDLLKIDVEGHELDVLRGGEAIFSRRGVRVVTFEFGGCNIDTRTFVRDFWYFFMDFGMKSFHRIMPNGRLFRFEEYNETIETFRTTNFLVVLDEQIDTTALE